MHSSQAHFCCYQHLSTFSAAFHARFASSLWIGSTILVCLNNMANEWLLTCTHLKIHSYANYSVVLSFLSRYQSQENKVGKNQTKVDVTLYTKSEVSC